MKKLIIFLFVVSWLNTSNSNECKGDAYVDSVEAAKAPPSFLDFKENKKV